MPQLPPGTERLAAKLSAPVAPTPEKAIRRILEREAALNLADRAVYALAMSLFAQLLFKGGWLLIADVSLWQQSH